MLWVAVVYAAVGTVLAHLIGRPLIHLNFQQQQREADFRYALVRIRENADGIALYGGELVEAATLSERFHRIIDNWKSIMLAQKRLTWFTAGYSQVAMIFPILVGAPRYFSGAIELGGLMQISSAFGQVQNALSWFVEAYASLAEWKATVDRLATFEAAVRDAHDAPDTAGVRSEGNAGAIIAQGVELHLPNGAVLARDVRLDIEPGARMLISGPSGCGKSTLFRAIAGIWPHWQGSLTIPKGDKVLFLPQMPYLPLGTLAQAVAYPDRPDAHGLAALADALNAVGLGILVPRLDVAGNWAQTLSPGEQQRVAFARALLVRPQWLFLDEATSALDESAEAALYKALLERLPATAVISIAHRATVKAFHEDQPVIDWALQLT
jgi:putative ATP-binding cassette transporter